MSKHTPGPWAFVQGGSGDFPTWNVRIGTRGTITLPPTASMETMDADARLIAAGPDLLEALKAVVALWDHHCYAHGDKDPTPLHIKARAAIDKAEGRA